MARNKAEKIQITVKKSRQPKTTDKTSKTVKKLNVQDSLAAESAALEYDGGFAKAMHAPGEMVVPALSRNDSKVEPVQAEEASEEPAGSKEPEKLSGTTGDDKATESQPDTPEPDGVNDSYDNFYSSKLDPDKLAEKERNLHHATSSHTLLSGRFWFIFLIFLVTTLAGLVMLYQLEQAQPGAGIIFDWL